MAHQAEIGFRMKLHEMGPDVPFSDLRSIKDYDVVFVRLPTVGSPRPTERFTPESLPKSDLLKVTSFLCRVAQEVKPRGKLALLGDPHVLPYIQAFLDGTLRFHHWIAVRLTRATGRDGSLANEHMGLVLYSKGLQSLDQAKVRLAYEYCPFCDRTTKDYGGKKHLYHSYGTLMSDVWRDIKIERGDPTPRAVIDRVRDMFSVGDNKRMLLIPISGAEELPQSTEELGLSRAFPEIKKLRPRKAVGPLSLPRDTLFNGDAITTLSSIPDSSVDFAFADPPYNLSKKYRGYHDDIEIDHYFEWCDRWLEHLCRVLKPGGSLAVINIPLWGIRNYLYLRQRLTFQNWIVWESLSLPVGFLMPSHYPILLFTKGPKPKSWNYTPLGDVDLVPLSERGDQTLYPLADLFCSRGSCISKRQRKGLDPRKELTDLWTDIHRIKHNSRRADHPCQLPPKLMRRIITLLTDPGDVVLDAFNGVGTTTLCAHQLGRKYIGIEIDELYHRIALERHRLIEQGKDPFAKKKRIPAAKNSPVPRVIHTKYEVPKKTLQLAVRRLAQKLDRIPSHKDVERYGEYPIEYYDDYFRNWSEVTAAARTTGMSERRTSRKEQISIFDFEE